MMLNLSKLIWCEREGEHLYAFERGLVFRPKVVKIADYAKEYDALVKWINQLLADQPPPEPIAVK
jgi:hypothetical protein